MMDTPPGWKRALGCNLRALAFFRIALASLLLAELILRFQYLHAFYTDEGTLPLRFLMPKSDFIYKMVCLHCFSGSMEFQRTLLSLQVFFASMLLLGIRPQFSAFVSWFLYLSLTLRNPWLAFILDRYFHYLLFYASFLPTGEVYSILQRKNHNPNQVIVTPATIFLKLQIFWIYLDAGGGKYLDPNGGWTWTAQPLPALDTYARHTIGARYLYALLGGFGWRILTPVVMYVELLAAPIALLGSLLHLNKIVSMSIAVVCALHVGIAITIRNAVLLSLVACCSWLVFLPESKKSAREKKRNYDTVSTKGKMMSILMIGSFVAGSVWFEMGECDPSNTRVWSTLLHNRWNVFVGAEEYVTWEIAPGRLADNSIVDVWSQSDEVSWELPGTGAPCTSTAKKGRWRSFPYLGNFTEEEEEVLWGYLCQQWDKEHEVYSKNPGKQLMRFNFYMMQADVLPNMGFSESRKRLIRSQVCVEGGGEVGGEEEEVQARAVEGEEYLTEDDVEEEEDEAAEYDEEEEEEDWEEEEEWEEEYTEEQPEEGEEVWEEEEEGEWEEHPEEGEGEWEEEYPEEEEGEWEEEEAEGDEEWEEEEEGEWEEEEEERTSKGEL